ncbi:MAG: response regulator [Polyangiaceae bacterium]
MLDHVQSGLLLLVDADRRVQRGVTRVAGEMGVEVVACDSARAGLNAACALEPAAIVTELELPDFDGYWFVAQIRQQPTEVAACPIVVVTHEIDTSSRAGTLKAGADVFLQKPIAPADLVAQTRALVDMASRVRDRRGTPPGVLGAGLAPVALAAPHLLPPSGGLDRFPAATVLVALELERRSGKVTLRPPSSAAPPVEIEIASGLIVEGRTNGKKLDPLAVVRVALSLQEGYFEFVPGPDRPALPTLEFTGKLFALAAIEAPPRSRRHAAPPPPPPVEVIEPSLVDEILSERPLPKPTNKAATRPPPAKTEPAPPKTEAPPAKTPRESVRPPNARASRAPKIATRPPPVKVPPARVPSFEPLPRSPRPPPRSRPRRSPRSPP